ncbi:LysE family translocator [Desulfofustis glycolicus]|uniref:Threonine/homoserine/homoserine lactone efflux protein n=1 Tax=Desulfofustis glycolicus DSM 9705 TaxID=1121409 RepID=A0A1M5TRS6_9BACT|nr:LysE family translocator [Desulfofustis glycolicus]MCB2216547.1 LysE family translocator [Desulfobulbaceae bacterium]SHH53103.1 Threonine/homoserine/homoserine lactone efflux protein [Desulfofustis glycolicus DSM 9705]
MSLEIWIAYLVATTLILVIPGPTIILVISQAITHGRGSVVPLAAGVVLGDLTAMTCSLLGLGALISTSATLFIVFKWIGAAYLLFLGIKLWRATPDLVAGHRQPAGFSQRSLLRSSFVVTALNPKSIAFFVAFLPQFITTGKPVWSQLLLLGGTFLLLALINAALYASFASRLREAVGKKHVRTWFNRCGGAALIGAGVVTAAMQRTS